MPGRRGTEAHGEKVIGHLPDGRWPIRLVAHNLDTFRSSHEVIDQCANQRYKKNKEKPGNFIIPFGRFFCQTVNKYPDPEDSHERRQASSTEEQ
jgi:hypothetical protein